MVSNSVIYLEGGGGADLDTRCQKGFNRLLQAMGFRGRMPRLVACGSRMDAFDRFKTAVGQRKASFIGLWIDSEDPVGLTHTDSDAKWDELQAWKHLQLRDGWERPKEATDHQVLLMVTCMETWILACRSTLESEFRGHYSNQLGALEELEKRERGIVYDQLVSATRPCNKRYAKGKVSFELLGMLQPEELTLHLGSFRRVQRILNAKLR